MEYVALAEFIKYGTAPLLLAVIILLVIVIVRQNNMQVALNDIRSGITWGDTCTEKHKALENRMEHIDCRVTDLERNRRKEDG